MKVKGTIKKKQILATIKALTIFTKIVTPFSYEESKNDDGTLKGYKFKIEVEDKTIQKNVVKYLKSLTGFIIED